MSYMLIWLAYWDSQVVKRIGIMCIQKIEASAFIWLVLVVYHMSAEYCEIEYGLFQCHVYISIRVVPAVTIISIAFFHDTNLFLTYI